MRSRRFALMMIAAVLALGVLAGARDRFDDWVQATDLPRLDIPVGVEVVARDGSLLRAFQVSDGRWRLEPGAVDPLFLDMLVMWEDRRFADHSGIDPAAMLRAGVGGTVVVVAEVDAQGNPVDVRVVERSGERDLDRAAVNAVRQWRFEPAMRNGKAIATSVKVPVDFKPI